MGGVIGAKYYYPDLNMVSTPRLDLCVHAPKDHFDLEFMKHLDPALKRSAATNGHSRVALHFIRRKESFFTRDESGNFWADPVECLTDLYEAALDPQALEFQTHLLKRAQSSNGRR